MPGRCCSTLALLDLLGESGDKMIGKITPVHRTDFRVLRPDAVTAVSHPRAKFRRLLARRFLQASFVMAGRPSHGSRSGSSAFVTIGRIAESPARSLAAQC